MPPRAKLTALRLHAARRSLGPMLVIACDLHAVLRMLCAPSVCTCPPHPPVRLSAPPQRKKEGAVGAAGSAPRTSLTAQEYAALRASVQQATANNRLQAAQAGAQAAQAGGPV